MATATTKSPLKILFCARLTAEDMELLRHRAKVEQIAPTTLARQILRGYLKDKATKQEAAPRF